MKWQLSFRLFSVIAVASALGVPDALALSPANPQPTSPAASLMSVEFPRTRDRGSPDSTTGGGTRSGETCISSQGTPLTALMPSSRNVGKTVQDTPTLYWYVPETTARTGEFVLIDEDSNEIYFEAFDLPNTPSIVSLTLPAGIDLKVGKNYLWYFSVVCNESDRSHDRYVTGELERTELSQSVKREINRLSPLEQAEIYAEYQIWHETLSLIEQLRLAQPQQWQELLTSVGLEIFVEEEIQPLTITEESPFSSTTN